MGIFDKAVEVFKKVEDKGEEYIDKASSKVREVVRDKVDDYKESRRQNQEDNKEYQEEQRYKQSKPSRQPRQLSKRQQIGKALVEQFIQQQSRQPRQPIGKNFTEMLEYGDNRQAFGQELDTRQEVMRASRKLTPDVVRPTFKNIFDMQPQSNKSSTQPKFKNIFSLQPQTYKKGSKTPKFNRLW